jgi:hypothetical protein
VTGVLRSRAALQTEILILRHQLNVLRRRAPKRVAVRNVDRLVFAGLNRLAPEMLDAVKILKPETVIRWHRAGFRAGWRWKSRPRGGRPRTPDEVCQLIREMSVANPLWGAPRIHGELLKLGMDVGQTTVAKYMARKRRPPSQGWKTFLHNHADAIAAIERRSGVTCAEQAACFPASLGGAASPVCSSLSFRQGQGLIASAINPDLVLKNLTGCQCFSIYSGRNKI